MPAFGAADELEEMKLMSARAPMTFPTYRRLMIVLRLFDEDVLLANRKSSGRQTEPIDSRPVKQMRLRKHDNLVRHAAPTV